MPISVKEQQDKYSRLGNVYLYLNPMLNAAGRVDLALSGNNARNLLPDWCPRPSTGTYIGRISDLQVLRGADYKPQSRGNDKNPYSWKVEKEDYGLKFNLLFNNDPATYHLYKFVGGSSQQPGEYFEGGNSLARTARILIVILNLRAKVLQYVECRLYYNVLIKAANETLTSAGDTAIAMDLEVGNSTNPTGDCLPEGTRKMRGWFANPANNLLVDPADYV